MAARITGFGDVGDLLKTGPTVWFGGHAEESGDLVAVTSGNFRMNFRRQDVIETAQFGKLDAICVPVDANIVVEAQLVAKAGDTSGCGCSAGGEGGKPRANRTGRDWFGGDYDVGFFEAGGCWLKIECFQIQGRRICVVVGIICPTFSTGED